MQPRACLAPPRPGRSALRRPSPAAIPNLAIAGRNSVAGAQQRGAPPSNKARSPSEVSSNWHAVCRELRGFVERSTPRSEPTSTKGQAPARHRRPEKATSEQQQQQQAAGDKIRTAPRFDRAASAPPARRDYEFKFHPKTNWLDGRWRRLAASSPFEKSGPLSLTKIKRSQEGGEIRPPPANSTGPGRRPGQPSFRNGYCIDLRPARPQSPRDSDETT